MLWAVVLAFLLSFLVIVLLRSVPAPEGEEAARRRRGMVADPAVHALDALAPAAFEALVRDLLGTLGLVVEEASVEEDGEEGEMVLSLSARDERPLVGGRYEVRGLFGRAGRSVAADEVRWFRETARSPEVLKGLLVTTSDFTDEAREVLQDTVVVPLDGVAFAEFVRQRLPGRLEAAGDGRSG